MNYSGSIEYLSLRLWKCNATYSKIPLPLDVLRKVGERLGVDEAILVVVAIVSVVGGDGVAGLSAGPVLVYRRGSVGVGVEVDVGALHLK